MKKNARSGFTFAELLVVMAIIGVLSALVYVSVGSAREDAKMAASVQNIRSLETAVRLYYHHTHTLPPTCRLGDCDADNDPLLNAPPGVSGWNGPYHSGMHNFTHGWGGHIGILKINCGGGDGTYLILDDDSPGGSTGNNDGRIPSRILQKIDEELDDGDLSEGRITGDGKTGGCPTGAEGEIAIEVLP